MPLLLLMALSVISSCATAAESKELELKYDDGKSDGSYSMGGYGFLVHFTPPATPFTINKIKIFSYLQGTGYENQTTKLEIWNEDFTILHVWQEPATEFNQEPSWMIVDIPQVTVDSDFYIVFYPEASKDSGVQVGYDSSVTNRHSDVALHGEIIKWISERLPKGKTNWMIRVIGTTEALD